MIPVLLTKVKTSDGVALDGIYVKPHKKSKTALIWLHGLSSRFSSGQSLIRELSSRCASRGVGYFKFNNRGHDIINRDGSGKKLLGTAFEKFDDCIHDIRAMIRFAQKRGYTKMILAGHSTGTNKALYYMYRTRDSRVKGLALLGPISDISYGYMAFGRKTIRRRLDLAEKIRKSKPLALLPQEFGIWTAQRYVNILAEGRSEDVFPYYNQRARWKELKSVHAPVAILIGSRDEYLDRPAKELAEIFQKNARSTKSFSGIIIKGARHGFRKKERELAQKIINWLEAVEADKR